MDRDWIIVIVGWGAIIGWLVIYTIQEMMKPKEQKDREREALQNAFKVQREQNKINRQIERQRRKANAPAEGCLERCFKILLLSVVAFICFVVCIMVIASTS